MAFGRCPGVTLSVCDRSSLNDEIRNAPNCQISSYIENRRTWPPNLARFILSNL